MPPYFVELSQTASRTLSAIADPTRQHILDALEGLSANPRQGFRTMSSNWQIWVAGHRIVYSFADHVSVFLIEPDDVLADIPPLDPPDPDEEAELASGAERPGRSGEAGPVAEARRFVRTVGDASGRLARELSKHFRDRDR